jgi:hypothetical protein
MPSARRVVADERRGRGMAHVATFHGEHFSGDPDGGDLKIYSHLDEHGSHQNSRAAPI